LKKKTITISFTFFINWNPYWAIFQNPRKKIIINVTSRWNYDQFEKVEGHISVIATRP
jgi:hypothetical protein